MSELKFNPRMLTLAREARGLSQNELGEKLKYTAHVIINKWEQGRVNVTEDNIRQLSDALKFPIEFFYQTGEIFPPTYYRKRDTVSAKILNSLDANQNIYRLNITRLLETIKQEPANLPALPLSKHETPEKAARELRKLWKIPNGTIANLTEIMESKNILIASIDFGTERVDSRSILTEHKHAIVFTNKIMLGDRLRFTLAYELGHLVMHTSGLSAYGDQAGHEANLFTAEFLMPEKDILSDFKNKNITIPLLAELKKKWGVSMQSLLYRADSLGLIDYNQKRYLLTQFNGLKIRRREPVELDIPIEKPELLKDIIRNYTNKQKLSLEGIAKFFCLTKEEFMKRFVK